MMIINIKIIFVVFFCVVILVGCQNHWPNNLSEVMSNQYHSHYPTQKSRLEIDVSKGFSGSVFYIGSSQDFDYFKVENIKRYFRLRNGYVRVPHVFDVGEGQPYVVPYEVFSRNWKHER